MLIKNIQINGIPYRFSLSKSSRNTDNHITIIIGKNASGKSEVLKEICHLLIRAQIKNDINSKYVDILDHYLDRNYKNLLHKGENNLSSKIELSSNDDTFFLEYTRTNERREFINFLGETEYLDEQVFRHYFSVKEKNSMETMTLKKVNIICVSSGQFDKFPVLQSMGLASDTGIKYSYIGVQNDSLSYRYDSTLALKVGEIGLSLIRFSVETKKIKLDKLLKSMGLSNEVTLKYELDRRFVGRDYTKNDTLKVHGAEISSVGLGQNNRLDKEEKLMIEKALKYFEALQSKSHEDKTINVKLTSNSGSLKTQFLYYASKVNAIEIKDVVFKKEGIDYPLSMGSSGELNLLNIFFGISSCIEDNSLILIDEPEISLHSDWQMQFIPLIKETFSNYKGCHYIIATHAPMVITNIGESNSSILNMSTKETVSSKEYNHQSSDYINSYLFGTPGHKNETLNREIVSLLSAISKRKKLDESKLEKAKLIIKWAESLVDEDPIKTLASILEEALKVYENDH